MKTATMSFDEMKDTAKGIYEALTQSDRQILSDLICKTEKNPEIIDSLKLYLNNCLEKLQR